jgi:predicted nuclease of restriction endonuclease-like RecB superfamily
VLEIVGFWTPDYLRRKLALYREARLSNLILCIDQARACDENRLPGGAAIVSLRPHVDTAAVRSSPAAAAGRRRHARGRSVRATAQCPTAAL